MRRKLIAVLRERGIRDERVLAAMAQLPRHFFLEKAFEEWAYTDKAFPIAKGQTISQPYTVAYQTALLELKEGEKVLEIGTGSGYQAAVLGMMNLEVHSVERHEALYRSATKILHQLGLQHVNTYHHDGNIGYAPAAPFDKILATAAAEKIPIPLFEQLRVGGILVLPVGDEHQQKMIKIQKTTTHEWIQWELEDFKFVPFLEGKA